MECSAAPAPGSALTRLTNAFVGRAKAPSHQDLDITLGASQELWRELIVELRGAGVVDGKEWGTYSKKVGWSLRLKRKDRIIVYLSPAIGCFMASFILGDKALASLKQTELSSEAKKLIQEGKRYAEGTAIRVEVRSQADVELVKKLAAAKVSH